MEEVVKLISQGNIDDMLVASGKHSAVEEVGNALDKMLNIQDDLYEICHPNHKIDAGLDHLVSNRVAIDKKYLGKSATFPPAAFPSAHKMTAGVYPNGESSTKPGSRASTRSLSIPIVSAMKGGNDQQGTPRKTKMNVTWAPDVYDPTPTSLSHTVKSSHSQQRLHSRSSRRKDNKQKHKKGSKSNRGSSGEKRNHTNHKSIGTGSYPLYSRLPWERSHLDGFKSSGIATLEFSVSSSQDSKKCGSNSFLGSSLSEVNCRVTEA